MTALLGLNLRNESRLRRRCTAIGWVVAPHAFPPLLANLGLQVSEEVTLVAVDRTHTAFNDSTTPATCMRITGDGLASDCFLFNNAEEGKIVMFQSCAVICHFVDSLTDLSLWSHSHVKIVDSCWLSPLVYSVRAWARTFISFARLTPGYGKFRSPAFISDKLWPLILACSMLISLDWHCSGCIWE